ncbi:hypothetical protein Tco_0959714 [Tanacetum coccineum]
MSRDHLLPGKRGGCSKVFATFPVAKISLGLLEKLERRFFLKPVEAFSVIIRSSIGGYLSCFNPNKYAALHVNLVTKALGAFTLPLFNVMHFDDATCFLTIPPYSGRVLEGSCRGLLFHHWSPHEKASLVHLAEDNPQSNGRIGHATSIFCEKARLLPSEFLSTLLPSLFGASSDSTAFSLYLRALGDLVRRNGVVSLMRTSLGSTSLSSLFSSLKYSNLVRRKALVERENVSLDLTKSDLCPSFVEDLTAKGMGLRVANSHTGNHHEDDFTPLETI